MFCVLPIGQDNIMIYSHGTMYKVTHVWVGDLFHIHMVYLMSFLSRGPPVNCLLRMEAFLLGNQRRNAASIDLNTNLVHFRAF